MTAGGMKHPVCGGSEMRTAETLWTPVRRNMHGSGERDSANRNLIGLDPAYK